MSSDWEGTEVAIVGMAGRFPGAADLGELWRNLRDGVESVRRLGAEELAARGVDPALSDDPAWVPAVAEMADFDRFDAAFFGVNPREAEVLDPQHRVLLEVAWEALEDAGYAPETCPGAVGVFAGATTSTYLVFNLMANAALRRAVEPLQLLVGNSVDTLATRVSYKLDLTGPSHAVQCACSTSLLAVHCACQSLLAEECDLALAGGVSINVGQRGGYRFEEGSILSPDGACRAFDARAGGTVFGSGAGIVVLRRLADALAAGDQVRAVIRASATNNDGSLKVGFTAPSVEGQARVISEALSLAGVRADSVSYVEAHGTATALGDPIEIQALTKAFRTSTERRGFCAIGSVKTNVGHLDIAAGVAGLAKTVLALEHGEIPASLHFEAPNPEIDFASSPVYVAAERRPWPRGEAPRRAGVSSFGFGGTNVHLIVEEAPPPRPPPPPRPWYLLPLSARTAEALATATSNLARHLAEHPELDLGDVAHTLQAGRRAFRHRRLLVARDREDAVAALGDPEGRRLLGVADRQDLRERPVYFLFPGQGSQYPGMGRELYGAEEVFRGEVDRCAELLAPELGIDLRTLLFPPPGEEEGAAARLAETALTQPALFTVEYALARQWQAWGVSPRGMIGHSLGEVVAAAVAGVFPLAEALRLVALRGRLMGECPPGAMLAVPLPEAEVAALVAADGGGELALAAVNGPASCVVSGPAPAVDELVRRLGERGVEGRRLRTSHAFHSPLVEPAVEPFAAALAGLSPAPPEIPFVSNATGTWITAEEAADPGYWARQLRRPVRFGDGVAALLAEPEALLLEVGPGRTLASLVGRLPGAPAVVTSLPHPTEATSDHAFALTALGRLWLAGLVLDWGRAGAGPGRRRVSLPTYPFERQRYWIEPEGSAAPAPLAGLRAAPEEWFYLPSWRLTMAPAPAAVPPGRWLILSDAGGLGERLAARLAADGCRVVAVAAGEGFRRLADGGYAIDPRRREDYEALAADLAARGLLPDAVAHLWALAPPAGAGAAPAAAGGKPNGAVAAAEGAAGALGLNALDGGLASVLRLARALAAVEPGRPLRLEVVASRLAALAPGEEPDPRRAALLAAVKVLPQELPGLACRALDVVLPAAGPELEQLAVGLAAELAAAGGEGLVARRGERRWVATYEPLPLAAPARPLRSLAAGGTYLLTGGLAGVGLALGRELARRRARLLFVEAPGFPPPEERSDWRRGHGEEDPVSRRLARVGELEGLGAEVLVVAAEPESAAEMRRTVAAAVDRWGRLDGVFHAAGGPGEASFGGVREVDAGACRAQLLAQGRVLEALEAALEAAPGAFCVAFSSLFAVLGGPGALAAAAAAAHLDAFCESRAVRHGGRWITVDWELWRLAEGPDLAALVGEELAALALSPEEGTTALERILAAATAPRLVVSTSDLGTRLRRWLERPGTAAAPTALPGRHPRPDIGTPYAAPDGETERLVAGIWEELLGVDRVGRNDNFFDLGGHSLLSTQLASRLKAACGVELPLGSLFEVPTVAGQAAAVETLRWAAQGPVLAAAGEEREEGEI